MNVSELIEKLQEYPPDYRVVIDGYEGGLEDVTKITTIPIVLNENELDYFGPHEQWSSYSNLPPDEIVVYLPR